MRRPSLDLQLVHTQSSPSASMAHWLSTREAPWHFTVDRDCELKAADEQKSAVRYARHTLEIDEVAQHIAAGKVPTQLALTWNDRVSFVLSEAGQIRRLKMLDVVLKESEDAQDQGRRQLRRQRRDPDRRTLAADSGSAGGAGGEAVPGAQPEALAA